MFALRDTRMRPLASTSFCLRWAEMPGKPTYVHVYLIIPHDPLILPTQYDYTDGQLDELLDVIINGKAALSVSAVGVPPKAAVDELHAPGIPVMKQAFPFGSVACTNNSANVAWLVTQRYDSDVQHPV
jgi:hypothetical protein